MRLDSSTIYGDLTVTGDIKNDKFDLHSHDDKYYTETEIDTKLNGKANTSHGNHVPTTQTANNAVFLRNDNTWATVTPANIGAATTAVVTKTTAGLMSGDDKTKLDTIATNANNYVLPTASTTVLGGVKIGTGLIIQNDIVSVATDIVAGSVAWGNVTGKPTTFAPSAHGNHVPAVETANNSKFLRNDNTWQVVTPANIGAVDSVGTIVANRISVFNDTAGNIKDSGFIINDSTTTSTNIWTASKTNNEINTKTSITTGTSIPTTDYWFKVIG